MPLYFLKHSATGQPLMLECVPTEDGPRFYLNVNGDVLWTSDNLEHTEWLQRTEVAATDNMTRPENPYAGECVVAFVVGVQ